MKNITLFICMYLMLNTVKAQHYFPFPDSNAIWSVSEIKYGVKGDTIINSLKYKKYYRQINFITFDFSHTKYFAAIREDSKKIYGIEDSQSVEKLLYDFTLKKGDTVFTHPFEIEYMGKVDRILKIGRIDSVLIDGNFRKKYFITSFYGDHGVVDEYWIEGIGSTTGIFSQGKSYNCGFDCGVSFLLCFHQNDTIKFRNTYFPTCFEKTVGLKEIENSKTKSILFPNPVTGISILKTNYDTKNGRYIRFYDSFGREVFSCFSKENEIKINKLDFYRGIFFYQIQDNSKIIDSGSFIVD